MVTAQGRWRADQKDGLVGPNGYTKPWPDNFLNLQDLGVCPSCATTPARHWGALVGYIGTAPPAAGSYTHRASRTAAERVFPVGNSFRSLVESTGELWLAFNDDAYSGYTVDNGGRLRVRVTLSARA